ncbi:MAG: ribonuclease HI [Nocardioides sp.]|nr:ribonuclease HI [Nocardioides sp.]
MTAPTDALSVFTDGACAGNPGRGGWAWAVDRSTYDSGFEAVTTNQRMEIKAALEAVTTLPPPLLVVSDSTYVVNCFRDRWWEKWLLNGWLTSAKKPVTNRDLWEPLVHSGHMMNDFVDQLAVEACRRG